MKTEISKPASLETVTATRLTSEQLIAKHAELKQQHEAEMADLRRQQDEASRIIHPLNCKIQEREKLLERIAKGEKQLAKQVEMQALFEAEHLDQYIGLPQTNGDMLNFAFLHSGSGCATHANAERGVALIGKWMKAKKTELADLENFMRTYAKQHGLGYMLPAEMAA